MRTLIWTAAALLAVVAPGVRAWQGIQPAAAAQDHVVKVDDKDRDQLQWKFDPQELDIAAGDSVTWDLTDAQISHSATADDQSWDSGSSRRGASGHTRSTSPVSTSTTASRTPGKRVSYA